MLKKGCESDDLAGKISVLPRLLGCAIYNGSEKVKAANPETYITSDIPPFFIQHGTGDELVPYQQSVIFAQKLAAAAAGQEKVVLELLESAGHASVPFETMKNINRVFNFIGRRL